MLHVCGCECMSMIQHWLSSSCIAVIPKCCFRVHAVSIQVPRSLLHQWHSSLTSVNLTWRPDRNPQLAEVLETSSFLTGAAPFLLGIGPSGLPIGETSIAVIDMAMLMAHTFWNEVRVNVVTAMPGSWTSKIVVIAAPGLLVCRPSEVPIGVSGTAVVPDMLCTWHGSLWHKCSWDIMHHISQDTFSEVVHSDSHALAKVMES